MLPFKNFLFSVLQTLAALSLCAHAMAAGDPPVKPVPENAYILGDSIAYGLSLDGLEAKLKARLGGEVRINYDGARSIITPGNQIKKSALDSIELDKEFISHAGVVVLVLGMNQMEPSFADSQRLLMARLKEIAPKARYYWVDIGATISTQADGWSARNKIIYDNASTLGYRVVSRYRAIFGYGADPLHITPGKNFPNWTSEQGYGGPGNVHGYYTELSQAIVTAMALHQPACNRAGGWSSYVLGDSISYGLHLDELEAKLEAQLGGPSRINYDIGRSITTPGITIRKSALDAVELDRDFIADAKVVVIVLGTNQAEGSFSDSQALLMRKLREIAPDAQYYWIDIGATIATQAKSWSERNRTIYANAAPLGYKVISRYKAIFGPSADPLNITAGANFPGWLTEPGFGASGNVHGAQAELTPAVLQALPKPLEQPAASKAEGCD